MKFAELVKKSRSYRRFDETAPIAREDLLQLVNLARMSPSAANQQPLKYFLSSDPETNAKIFPSLSWARYLGEWAGPEEGERPTGFIVICADSTITKNIWCDDGIAAQTMMLGAVSMGLGGCIIGAIEKDALRESISLPDHLEIRLVLALGKPAEEVKLEPADGSIRYWRDENGVHHVPKRPLDEIIVSPPRQIVNKPFIPVGFE
jgi:nitroreductase